MLKLKLAVQSPTHAAMVKLHNGMSITRAKALASGYTIAKDEADAASIRATAGNLSGAGSAYLDKLLALPEGRDRPLAASRIAAQHTGETMTLKKAALFLSGLPIETAEPEEAPLKTYPKAADALMKRKVELHLFSLDRRAMHGDRDAKADAVKIRYGLEICATSTMQCAYALKAAGVDLDKLSKEMRQ